jgi:VanZ family protein
LKNVLRFLQRWLPVILWAGLVLYASTSVGSSPRTGSLLETWVRWLFPDGDFTHLLRGFNIAMRKVAHAFQFFILALLIWRGVRVKPPLQRSDRFLAGGILAFSALIAALSEGIQMLSPTRGPSVMDFFIDMAGAILAIVLIFLWKRRPGRRDQGPLPGSNPALTAGDEKGVAAP